MSSISSAVTDATRLLTSSSTPRPTPTLQLQHLFPLLILLRIRQLPLLSNTPTIVQLHVALRGPPPSSPPTIALRNQSKRSYFLDANLNHQRLRHLLPSFIVGLRLLARKLQTASLVLSQFQNNSVLLIISHQRTPNSTCRHHKRPALLLPLWWQ